MWYGNQAVGALSLDLGVLLRDRVRVGVLGLVGLPVLRGLVSPPTDLKIAIVQSVDIGVFGLVGVCTRTALAVCGHALGGMRLTWARATTSTDTTRLPSTQSGVISVPELGVLARVQYLLRGQLLLALDLLGGVPLVPGTFKIDGFDQPFSTPPFDFQALLRAGVRL